MPPDGTPRAFETNGGFRLKFGTDDKGLILMAAWGLQPRWFEDNAERALAAPTRLAGAQRFRFAAAGFFTLKRQQAAAHYIVAGEAFEQPDHREQMVGRATERA